MNLASFDLNLLRVLDAVLQEGTTVKAGERIGLSQPAVSNALARLRQALKDDLFVREGGRLVPTDFARALAAPLREELDRLSALLDGAGSFDPAGADLSLRIAGSDFFVDMLMPALAARLAERAPRVRLHLIDLQRDSYVGTLDRYGADIALVPDGTFPDWIARRPLFRSSFAAIARRGHPALCDVAEGAVLPMETFCALDHVVFSPEGNHSAMGDEALARVGRSRRVRMTMPTFAGVCLAVAQSDMIAIVPRQFAAWKAGLLPLAVYRPPMDVPVPLIVAIWHRRATANPAQRWLRDEVAAVLGPLNAGEADLAPDN